MAQHLVGGGGSEEVLHEFGVRQRRLTTRLRLYSIDLELWACRRHVWTGMAVHDSATEEERREKRCDFGVSVSVRVHEMYLARPWVLWNKGISLQQRFQTLKHF